MQLPGSPAKPPNQLLSRKSDGEGVFDFDGVLDCKEEFTYDHAVDSDVDSFYSDSQFEHDETNSINEAVSENSNGDMDDGDTNSDYNNSDDSADDSDFSDNTYIQSDTTRSDIDNDSFSYLCHPICVVPDIGGEDANGYMMILPKGQWSQYFTRFYNKTI